MGKVKSYMMDIEEDVYAIEGLEEKISESEDISEVKAFVVEKLFPYFPLFLNLT